MTGALDGIRVLEVGTLISGPFAGRLLGDMGADVIKIEPPGSPDPIRTWGQAELDGQHFFWKMRQTDVVQKIDGKWKILHTHLSFGAVPQAKHPESWVVDFEMPKRPQPWDVAAELAGG